MPADGLLVSIALRTYRQVKQNACKLCGPVKQKTWSLESRRITQGAIVLGELSKLGAESESLSVILASLGAMDREGARMFVC